MANTPEIKWKVKQFRDKIHKSHEDAKKKGHKPGPLIFSDNKAKTVQVHQDIPEDGPGTELKLIFQSLSPKLFSKLGLDGTGGCGSCLSTLQGMNKVGPVECRRNVDRWATAIDTNRKKLGIKWFDLIKEAGPNVLRKGLPWSLKGLILEACDRAEAKQKAKENKHELGGRTDNM